MNIKDYKKFDEENFFKCGFQGTNIALATNILKKMKGSTIFLTFTSNMIASGLRGIITKLCMEKKVDAIITAGGSLDHDLIKCKKNYLVGDFITDDRELHKNGLNRIGNILVPNECYEYLETFMQKVFSEMDDRVSPSDIAKAIGKKTDESSFLYWAQKNNIPVFSPGITDSAIGLQAHFYKQKRKEFAIDVTKDMNELSQIALNAEKTGGLILGGGISKHHAIGVNLLRGGFDYAVYVTTSSPWDGSLSGARTNEGISWGKIKETANHVTIDCDATVALPLLMELSRW